MRAGLGRAMGLVLALAAVPAVASVQQVSHGRFDQVPVHVPAGAPQRVVIWFHDGADADDSRMPIEALRADGALVASVDVAHLRGVLKREGNSSCAFGAGDVENFSRWVQAFLHLPGYHLPLVGGSGEGAELAYALAAQADTQVFAGLLTSGFCPAHVHERMVCGDGVKHDRLQPSELNFPWLNAAGAPGCSTNSAGPFVQQVAMAREFKRTAAGDATPGLVAAARVIGAQAGV
ncbi:MAG: virulence factor family protein, partial [Stenotrophomonas indicatrix]